MIQTSWACNQKDLLKFNAGWYSPEYHLMGWALSCLQLKRYYKDVVLYADNVSAKMLIDVLQLPYTELICDLDKLNNIHPQLWAVPKIDSYSRQISPFLHVDGDVFIWKAFDYELLSNGLIAQNIEVSTNYYETNMQKLEKILTYFPQEIVEDREKYKPIYAYNAGIFGGNDIPFFKDYTAKSFEFIKRSEKHFSNIDVYAFNVFFEQYLFYALIEKQKKNVAVLLDEIFGDNGYRGFGEFYEVPHTKQYLHLLGPFKRNKTICEQMADRLRLDYPEYYYRIIALFKKENLPLKKDYYHFIDETSETSLFKRYTSLKGNTVQSHIAFTPEIKRDFNIHSDIANKVYSIIANGWTAPYADSFITALKKDMQTFELKLDEILNQKFINYSKDHLYARDIKHTIFYQMIFGDPSIGYNTKLIADSQLEIIDCKYNWHEVHNNLNLTLNTMPSVIHIGVIPECDVNGYSLVDMDELDMLILTCIEKPTNVTSLLDEVSGYFEPADLEHSQKEFELLIVGRIKSAIHSKIIKVANN